MFPTSVGALKTGYWNFPSLMASKLLQAHILQELARRSSRGRQIIAEKSGHYIQRDQPELVVDAIRAVVEEAK